MLPFEIQIVKKLYTVIRMMGTINSTHIKTIKS